MSTKGVKSMPGERLLVDPAHPVDPVGTVDPVGPVDPVDPVGPVSAGQDLNEEEAFDSLHKRKNWLTTAAATPWLDDEVGTILEAEDSRVVNVSTVITVAVEEEMIFEAESAHEEFHTHDHSEGEGEEGPEKKGVEETTSQEAIGVPGDTFSLEPATPAVGDVSASEPAVSFPTDAVPAQSTTDSGVSEPLAPSLGDASSVEMPVTAPSDGGIGTSSIDGAPSAPTSDDGSSTLSNSADSGNGQLSSTESGSSSIGSSSSSPDSTDSGIDHSSSLAGDPLVTADNSNSGSGDSLTSGLNDPGLNDPGLNDPGLNHNNQPDESSLNHNQLEFF